MANKLAPGFVRVKEQIPYEGKGADNLVLAVKTILEQNRYVQKIVLEVGKKHILIERAVPGEEVKELVTWYSAVRSHPMEEYVPEKELQPHQHFSEIISIIHAEGLEVSQVLIGDKKLFQAWLGVRIPVTKLAVFGIPITQIPDIPPDVFIVCGTNEREGSPEDVELSVKWTLP